MSGSLAQEPTVVIAEDDPELRAVLRLALVGAGYRVEEASDTDTLFAVLDRGQPRAVLLDDDLPGRAGLEVLPRLRERWPDVHVVVMTAFGGPRVREVALRLGAAGYLDKPFRTATLLEMLARVQHASSPTTDNDV